MSEPEFPQELVERCAKAIHKEWERGRALSSDSQAVAVLRESGHAELVAALKGLEPYLDAIVCYASTMNEHEPNRLVVNARAALRKAAA